METTLMKTDEAAKYLGISENAVRREVHEGRLRAETCRGRVRPWWFKPEELERWKKEEMQSVK